MKSFTGQSSNVTHPIIGRIAHNRVNIFVRRHTILATRNLHAGHSGYAALLVSRQQESLEPSTDAQRVVELQPTNLKPCILMTLWIEPSGKATILWDNDRRIMCSFRTTAATIAVSCPQPTAATTKIFAVSRRPPTQKALMSEWRLQEASQLRFDDSAR